MHTKTEASSRADFESARAGSRTWEDRGRAPLVGSGSPSRPGWAPAQDDLAVELGSPPRSRAREQWFPRSARAPLEELGFVGLTDQRRHKQVAASLPLVFSIAIMVLLVLTVLMILMILRVTEVIIRITEIIEIIRIKIEQMTTTTTQKHPPRGDV